MRVKSRAIQSPAARRMAHFSPGVQSSDATQVPTFAPNRKSTSVSTPSLSCDQKETILFNMADFTCSFETVVALRALIERRALYSSNGLAKPGVLADRIQFQLCLGLGSVLLQFHWCSTWQNGTGSHTSSQKTFWVDQSSCRKKSWHLCVHWAHIVRKLLTVRDLP